MFFIYTQLIMLIKISCIENGAGFTMKGITDIEPVDKKKSIARFQVDLFRKYTPVQLLISPIPGKMATLFIIFMKERLTTSTMSPGGNQRVLSRVSDSKSGDFGGIAAW
jgi:hypothetical protein